jgi:uncharacterized protein (TIGR03067 family)
MHMTRMAGLVAALALISTAHPADKPKEAPPALERKLYGEWKGGDCQGELTLKAEGTFRRRHYSPGNNTLTGTWAVRWDALPPTLVLTCTASDCQEFVGKEEVKLLQLDDAALVYQHAGGQQYRYTRVRAHAKPPEKELAALQGTWVPLYYEEGGKRVPGTYSCQHIIRGDRVTVQVNGQTKAEGKVVLDPTQNPKHLNLQFTSGGTDLLIYVRAGDYLIYCGNRGGKTRPSEFASGTAKGGEYLLVWKVER